MKAIGYIQGAIDINDENSLLDIELPRPELVEGQVLIEVLAVSVNPVDTKLRKMNFKNKDNKLTILGYDACGVISKIDKNVEGFEVGDKVYYAGSLTLQGSNQQYQLMDARLIAKAPANLSDAQNAAMPLTAITAYECLFEKMRIHFEKDANAGKNILIINGAGGVGSIATQLAKWAGLITITTASREESQNWCLKNGSDIVVNHKENLIEQLKQHYIDSVDYILILHSTEQYFEQAASLIKPLGHICSIEETNELLPLGLIKDKSVSFHWEMMFAKPIYNVCVASQGKILAKLTKLFESGELFHTLTTEINSGINASNLKEAHKLLESGSTIGKVVVSGDFS